MLEVTIDVAVNTFEELNVMGSVGDQLYLEDLLGFLLQENNDYILQE